MCDNVKHPEHYTKGNIECIDAIKESMSREAFEGYLKGNIIKYMWRYEDKNGLEDLCKAQTYLNWLIRYQTNQDTELSPKVENPEEVGISNKEFQLAYIKTLFNDLSFDLLNSGSIITIDQDIIDNNIIKLGIETEYLDDKPNVTKLLDTMLNSSASLIKSITNEDEYYIATIDCTDLDKEVTETLFNCLNALIEIDENNCSFDRDELWSVDGISEVDYREMTGYYD